MLFVKLFVLNLNLFRLYFLQSAYFTSTLILIVRTMLEYFLEFYLAPVNNDVLLANYICLDPTLHKMLIVTAAIKVEIEISTLLSISRYLGLI